jgi:3,4-dihydroxyphenylacetate 2,3-dioxygenase
MGELVFAAKVAHVPSIYAGEPGVHAPMEGKHEEVREAHRRMARRMRETGAETIVLVDTHWICTVNFHVNAAPHHEGLYTSEEQPHVIHDLAYSYPGDPILAHAIAAAGTAGGILTHAHDVKSLRLTYGALVPLRYANPEPRLRVVPIGANINASPRENMQFGQILAETIRTSGRRVAFLASGSLSHRFWTNELVMEHRWEISSEFNRQVDLRVLDLLKAGDHAAVIGMIPDYRHACAGECGMADTSILYGLLGGVRYREPVREYVPYFASGGNGQVMLEFPVPR